VAKEILKPECFITTNEIPLLLPGTTKGPWTINDDKSPGFFSESRSCIRNLLKDEHFMQLGTEYHIFHSVKDNLISVQLKDKLVDIFNKKSIPFFYMRVEDSDIDGYAFKNLEHGMKASLRGLFDQVAQVRCGNFSKKSVDTDFDLQSKNIFNCGDNSYIFEFDEKYNINVSIT